MMDLPQRQGLLPASSAVRGGEKLGAVLVASEEEMTWLTLMIAPPVTMQWLGIARSDVKNSMRRK